MTTPPSERTLIYAEDLRPEDVHALETFLNVQGAGVRGGRRDW